MRFYLAAYSEQRFCFFFSFNENYEFFKSSSKFKMLIGNFSNLFRISFEFISNLGTQRVNCWLHGTLEVRHFIGQVCQLRLYLSTLDLCSSRIFLKIKIYQEDFIYSAILTNDTKKISLFRILSYDNLKKKVNGRKFFESISFQASFLVAVDGWKFKCGVMSTVIVHKHQVLCIVQLEFNTKTLSSTSSKFIV